MLEMLENIRHPRNIEFNLSEISNILKLKQYASIWLLLQKTHGALLDDCFREFDPFWCNPHINTQHATRHMAQNTQPHAQHRPPYKHHRLRCCEAWEGAHKLQKLEKQI